VPALRATLRPDAMLWLSWLKKAAQTDTGLNEDRTRAVALPPGYVDIEVCAVNEVGSGLKRVVRKAPR